MTVFSILALSLVSWCETLCVVIHAGSLLLMLEARKAGENWNSSVSICRSILFADESQLLCPPFFTLISLSIHLNFSQEDHLAIPVQWNLRCILVLLKFLFSKFHLFNNHQVNMFMLIMLTERRLGYVRFVKECSFSVNIHRIQCIVLRIRCLILQWNIVVILPIIIKDS